MSDALIATLGGLVGVGLTGGVEVGLSAWRDFKERRVALRAVEFDLNRMMLRLSDNPADVERSGLLGTPQRGEHPAWSEHEDALARDFSRAKWMRVRDGFSSYEAWATFRAMEDEITDDGRDGSYARKLADDRYAETLRSVRRAHRLAAGYRGHRGAQKVWREVSPTRVLSNGR